jgi:hypothetical protein
LDIKPCLGGSAASGLQRPFNPAVSATSPPFAESVQLAKNIIALSRRLKLHPQRPCELTSSLAALQSADASMTLRRLEEILRQAASESLQLDLLLPPSRGQLTPQTKILVRALFIVMNIQDQLASAG